MDLINQAISTFSDGSSQLFGGIVAGLAFAVFADVVVKRDLFKDIFRKLMRRPIVFRVLIRLLVIFGNIDDEKIRRVEKKEVE